MIEIELILVVQMLALLTIAGRAGRILTTLRAIEKIGNRFAAAALVKTTAPPEQPPPPSEKTPMLDRLGSMQPWKAV